MRIIINIDSLFEFSCYLKQKSSELTELQKKLLNDMEKIKDSYKGIDADIFLGKYQNTVRELDYVINNFNNYANYFLKVTDMSSESLKKAVNHLNSLNVNVKNPINEVEGVLSGVDSENFDVFSQISEVI